MPPSSSYTRSTPLYENASQQFIHQINAALDETTSTTNVQQASSSVDEPMDEGEAETFQASSAVVAVPSGEDGGARGVVHRLTRILSGEETIKHHLQFLIKNNHTDILLLKQKFQRRVP